MKKPKSDELIQFRCQKWMKTYVEQQGNMTNGAAAWLRDLILEKYKEEHKPPYSSAEPSLPIVAENSPEYVKRKPDGHSTDI